VAAVCASGSIGAHLANRMRIARHPARSDLPAFKSLGLGWQAALLAHHFAHHQELVGVGARGGTRRPVHHSPLLVHHSPLLDGADRALVPHSGLTSGYAFPTSCPRRSATPMTRRLARRPTTQLQELLATPRIPLAGQRSSLSSTADRHAPQPGRRTRCALTCRFLGQTSDRGLRQDRATMSISTLAAPARLAGARRCLTQCRRLAETRPRFL
jgi:hypothetical protein